MRFVRFRADWSRSASTGDEFMKVAGDFGDESGGKACGHAKPAGEHAGQEAAKVAGTFFSVEGISDFSPIEGHRYVVTGALKNEEAVPTGANHAIVLMSVAFLNSIVWAIAARLLLCRFR